jgi:cell wall-associated NlpC family hydrolase
MPQRAVLTGVLVLAALAGGCASTGAVPRPFPMAGAPTARQGTAAGPIDIAQLTGTALSLRGSPYRNGGADPSGFDCSGFTQYVFARSGVSLPRAVKEQFDVGRPVAKEQIAAGDLLFYSTVAPGASHVGIALDGARFVHAPSSTGVVRIEQLASSYWSRRFVGARRLTN